MRIVHLCNRMGNLADGIINVVVDLATAQAADGHDVAVFSLGGDYEPLLHDHGVCTRTVDFSRRSPSRLFATARVLDHELRLFAPDIVHSHTMTPAVVAALLPRRGVRRVATAHNEFQRGARLMGLSDTVVCVSEGVRQKIDTSPLCRGKTTVVHNGIVGSPRRSAVGWPAIVSSDGLRTAGGAHPVILAVGSVSKRKGSDVLLGAFDRLADDHPTTRLRFVGNVDDPALIAPFVDRPWFDRVEFTGAVADPSAFFREADVMVVASRNDPHPLALLEGRQAGLPIVGSRVDGIPEGLENGAAGLLFESGDVDGLAELVRTLLASPAERARFGRAAAAGMERHSVTRMAAGYLRVYEALRA